MRILAIETSCDETAIAILEFSGQKRAPDIRVLSNIVSSQVKFHAKYGGVVPNLAKREHERNLVPILLSALGEAGMQNSKRKAQSPKPQYKSIKLEKILEREAELRAHFKKDILPLATPDIDAIAVTQGPGLAPALWVGVNFARALAVLWDKPIISVNHMMGHFFSALVEPAQKKKLRTWNLELSKKKISDQVLSSKFQVRAMRFPALALLVSGGHTELVLSKKWGRYEIIGETLDDASGEAFDKVARILGLGYPGGPAIAAIAGQTQNSKFKTQNQSVKLKTELPRPMIKSKDFNFSFSGLKTAALYLVEDWKKKYPLEKIRPAIAKEFQEAVCDVLVAKTIRAAKKYRAKTILLGGGVAANQLLREGLLYEVSKNLPNVNCHMSIVPLTGDNAFMIGLAAYFEGKKSASDTLEADANLTM